MLIFDRRSFRKRRMESERMVSVVVVDQALEHKGILANAAFVIGLSAGRELPGATFGPDVTDGDGKNHRYLTNIGHFIRKAGQAKIRTLRDEFAADDRTTVFDYSEDAAPSDYSEYEKSIASRRTDEISYRAIHIYGPESIVAPRTKNLSRLE